MVTLTDSCLEARSSSIRGRHVQRRVEEACSASVPMSPPLDGQSINIPPSLDARLNGVNLNGDVLESEASSPSFEQLQIIDDENNFTSVLLCSPCTFVTECSMTVLQTPLGLSNRTMGFARRRLPL